MIGTLEEWGYVFNTVRSGSCAVKINYVDWEGEPVLTINSFKDFIMDYYGYAGSKIIHCGECGRRIVAKRNTKYCPVCSKNKKRETARLRKQKERTQKNQ